MTQQIHALTLVDITNTNVTRVRENNTKEYHQQQNLNVLLQTIGLRTQVFDPQVTVLDKPVDLELHGFGNLFHDTTARAWGLKFYIEGDSVWQDGDDPLALLRQDVHGVAISGDLDNTVDFPVNIFDTHLNTNIRFGIS